MKTLNLVSATILLGFGAYYLIIGYLSLPEVVPRMYPTIPDPSKTLTFIPWDNHISNLENIIIHLSLFFGFMNMYDLLFDLKNAEKTYKTESVYKILVERFL